MSPSTTGGTAMGQPSDYDHATHDNQIVAVYATDGEAQAAKATLVSNGIPASAIQLTSRDATRDPGRDPGIAATGSDTVIPGSTDAGLWGAIRSLFVPDEDRNSYSHAIGHGHAVLVVTPTSGTDRSTAIHVLEGTNPVDFDAKLEEWRTSGYDYSQPHEQYAATSQAMGGAAPVGFASGAGGTATGPVGGTLAGDTMGGTARTDVSDTAGRAGAAVPAQGDDTLKVVEEQSRVGKREVAGGAMRVRSYVVERPT